MKEDKQNKRIAQEIYSRKYIKFKIITFTNKIIHKRTIKICRIKEYANKFKTVNRLVKIMNFTNKIQK